MGLIDRQRISAVREMEKLGYSFDLETGWTKAKEEPDEDEDDEVDEDDLLYYTDGCGDREPMRYSLLKSRLSAIRRLFASSGSPRTNGQKTLEGVWARVKDIEL